MAATELDWWTGNAAIRAAAIFAFFVLLAFIFDRWFAARGRRIADRMLRGGMTQQADTRLRFVRRLIAERRIAYIKVGRHVRIAEADLAGFVAAGRIEASA